MSDEVGTWITRRRLAVAPILDGGSRNKAVKGAGVTLQIIRDWVLRFNEGGLDGLKTRKAPGPAAILVASATRQQRPMY